MFTSYLCSGFLLLVVVVVVVIVVVRVRLTYNFNRRGGYTWPPWSGDEDYRWEFVQKGEYLKILTNPIIWVLFNFLFISFYQQFLLLAIVSPSFVAWSMSKIPECMDAVYSPQLNIYDVSATMLFVFFLIVESMADNQQYSFQNEKYRRQSKETMMEEESHFKDGFCQTGLFSIVRKPNYAAEQSIWVVYYIFSVGASGGKILLNWSIIGCTLLILLFQGSGRLTESITVKKYPKYVNYQNMVPLYLPTIASLKRKFKSD